MFFKVTFQEVKRFMPPHRDVTGIIREEEKTFEIGLSANIIFHLNLNLKFIYTQSLWTRQSLILFV